MCRDPPAPTWLWLVAGLLALGPAIVLVGRLAGPSDPGLPPIGDHAALELYTRLAAHGQQLLGPYSRFGFQHPGPAYFYAAVPLYRLFGDDFRGIKLTALSINALSIAVLLWMAGRGGSGALLAATLGLAGFVANRGPDWLYSAWNPSVVVLPFGVALFGAAAFAAGEAGALVLAVVAASFAVQTHLGTLPVLLTVLVLAIASRTPPVRRLWGLPNVGASSGTRGAAIAAVVAGAILWAPALAEQVEPGGGNLGRIARFTWAASDEGQSVGEAIATLVGKPFGLAVGTQTHTTILAGLVVLGVGLAYLHARNRHPFPAALSVVSLTGLVAAVAASTHLAGPVFGYVVRWMAMLAIAGLTAIGGVLALHTTTRWRLMVLAAVSVALAIVTTTNLRTAWHVRQRIPTPPRQSVAAGRIAAQIASGLERVHAQRVVFDVRPEADRDVVLGLLLALDKRGLSWAAYPFGPVALGGNWAPRGSEDAIIVMGAEGAVSGAPALASAGGQYAYLVRP